MVNQAYPSIDGIEPSWADIQVTFGVNNGGILIPMTAIVGIKTGRKVEVGQVRGASGGRVVARTTGQGDQEASATLYRAGYRQMLKGLMSLAPTRGNQLIVSLVTFNILVQHTPPGETEIYQRLLKGCRYLGEDDDMKEGTEPDKLEINLNPIEVVDIINGKEVVLL